MKPTKPIDLQDVEALKRRLKAQRITKTRFSIDLPLDDVKVGLYSSLAAIVEENGDQIDLTPRLQVILHKCALWLTNPNCSPGLLFSGLYGNGKTSVGECIIRLIELVTAHEYGPSKAIIATEISAKDLCHLCGRAERSNEAWKEYDALRTEPIVMLDEVGAEPVEVMVFGQPQTPVIDLLSTRYARRLMTIITTNLRAKELQDKYGPRIYERLKETMTTIKFDDPSFRHYVNLPQENEKH